MLFGVHDIGKSTFGAMICRPIFIQTEDGFRLHSGKQHCLVPDFGGNVLRHGPVDQIRVREIASARPGFAPAVQKVRGNLGGQIDQGDELMGKVCCESSMSWLR
ncbi:MAG: hypothetical protein NTW96_26405 [Planctomycetia bacterium]|nr:hypothetical protein [Planctomycetia bacterium]